MKWMGIKRVALRVLGCRNIETESRADQRAAGFGIGIGGQHPAFMPAVAKDTHQTAQAELDVRILEVEQRFGRKSMAQFAAADLPQMPRPAIVPEPQVALLARGHTCQRQPSRTRVSRSERVVQYGSLSWRSRSRTSLWKYTITENGCVRNREMRE